MFLILFRLFIKLKHNKIKLKYNKKTLPDKENPERRIFKVAKKKNGLEYRENTYSFAFFRSFFDEFV